MNELGKLAGSIVDTAAGVAGAAVGVAAEAVNSAGRLVRSGSVKPMQIVGTSTTCVLSGEDTQDQFAMFMIHAQPGQGVPTHHHEREDETFYVLEGQVRAELDGEVSILGPGETAHLRRNHPHAWFTHGDQPAKMLMISHPAGMDRFFPEIACRADGSNPTMDEVVATSARFGIIFPRPA